MISAADAIRGMKLSYARIAVALGGLALALTLIAPAAAEATVRSVTFTYDRPAQPPSLTPEPPITQTQAYVQSVSVRYDDRAGTLQAHMTVYDAAFWQGKLPGIWLDLDSTCDNATNGDALIVASFSYSVHDDEDDAGNPTSTTEAHATLTRAGYNGSAMGTVAPAADGGLDASFQHPTLVDLDLRCVGVSTGGSLGAQDSRYFDGYEPFELTKTNDTAAFKRALAQRYGSNFTRASRSWALCPPQEFFPKGLDDDGTPSAICMAQFKAGRTWRYVSATIDQGNQGAEMTKPYTRAWTRRWRKLGPKCLRQVRVKGHVASNDGSCPGLMVSDLAYAVRSHHSARRAFWHGTNTAGFQTVARYRCTTRGRSITCTNALGDAFRWTR